MIKMLIQETQLVLFLMIYTRDNYPSLYNTLYEDISLEATQSQCIYFFRVLCEKIGYGYVIYTTKSIDDVARYVKENKELMIILEL